jgi:hypothetical protein
MDHENTDSVENKQGAAALGAIYCFLELSGKEGLRLLCGKLIVGKLIVSQQRACTMRLHISRRLRSTRHAVVYMLKI